MPLPLGLLRKLTKTHRLKPAHIIAPFCLHMVRNFSAKTRHTLYIPFTPFILITSRSIPFFHCCLPVELPSNLLLAAKNRHYTMLATIMKQRWVTLVNSHPLVDLLAACGYVLTSVNTHPQARVPPLFHHWFSMTFPWPKKWKSMTYRHNIYFQVNDIRLMNAYQN